MTIKTYTLTDHYPIKSVYRGQTSTADQKVVLVNWREGNENPKWKQIIADGGNATTVLNAYSQSYESFNGSWAGYEDNYAGSSSTQQGIQTIVLPTWAPTKDLISQVEAGATTKAYQVINRLLSELQGQIFLGELRETIRLLRNPLAQSKKTFDAFFAKGKGKAGDEFAKSWLEFQFGIKPLLSDVDTIMGLINDKVERTRRNTFRVYDEADDFSTSISIGQYDVSGFNQHVTTDLSWKAQKIIRFAVTQQYLDMANERKTDWRRQFDDISAVPITAWELTPFSFLLDYFVNISDIIQAAVTSTAGVSYYSNSLIKTAVRRQIGTTLTTRAARFHITANIPRVCTTQQRWVTRNGSALGIPSVQFTLPGSNIRYLNIAALAATLTAEMRRAKR